MPTFKFKGDELTIEWSGPRPEVVVVNTKLLDALVEQVNIGRKAIAAIGVLRRMADAKAKQPDG